MKSVDNRIKQWYNSTVIMRKDGNENRDQNTFQVYSGV